MRVSQPIAGHPTAAQWLNIPCTDYLGRVILADGRIFRAVVPAKRAFALDVITAQSVTNLMIEGRIAKTWITDRQIDGAAAVLEVERAPFDVPPDRFIGSCLWRAFERWVEITLRLETSGLCLADAHFGNFMLFGRNDPRWVDLGSIRPIPDLPDETPFRRFKFLWQGIIAPLLVLRQHPRLVRLAIADFPYQGPYTVSGESPLLLDEIVTARSLELRAALHGLKGRDALARTLEIVRAWIGDRFVSAETDLPAAPLDPAVAHRLLTAAEARSVLCLGADLYQPVREVPGRFDVAVLDHDETRLEQVSAELQRRPRPAGHVALYLQHLLNRLFVRQPPTADAVVAYDPFTRFDHPADLAADNVAAILARLATRLAIVAVPAATGAAAAATLRRFFAEVTSEGTADGLVTFACRAPGAARRADA